MRVLIFSDTHLTDKFDEKKFAFLKRLITNSDKIVVNGDFWDGYLVSYEKFINSPWKKLLSLLDRRDVVYIVGNHDRAGKFKGVLGSYTLSLGGITYKIEHGDRLDKLSVFDRFGDNRFLGFVYFLLKNLEKWGVRIWGKNFLKIIYFGYNQGIKKEVGKEVKDGEIYVCGHSHISEMDLKNKFINTGIVDYGLGQYVLIDKKRARLFEENY